MYTDSDHEFDAENAHGWHPRRWVETWYCDQCDKEFSIAMSTSEDELLECPHCGNPYISS